MASHMQTKCCRALKARKDGFLAELPLEKRRRNPGLSLKPPRGSSCG
uniref:Uncharacterized protein n=1 Tax=Anguilla anguilla TaxID=7936 RepID=A0A0E9XL45_ANGAN